MNTLGQTDILVSELCLGTMTYSTHTPAEDAFAQMDMALDHGINFIDTAEMYPVNPIRAETVGDSEKVLGDWFEKTGRRAEWVLATKHSGVGSHARDGAPISASSIRPTLEASLKRLKTDYIDLYQFHWPNRGSYMFRQNWRYNPARSPQTASEIHEEMQACLAALQAEVDRGTLRAFGLSNESAWGTSQWLAAAAQAGGPRVASIQNEYSLMCRLADTDLAELMHYENVSLLPFSPLAAGLLTGKYQGDVTPTGSRRVNSPDLGGRMGPRTLPTAQAYLDLAARHGLDPVHMALAWSARRPFVASSIFGATTVTQLEHILGATETRLDAELLQEIDAVHKAHPMPY